MSLDAHELDEQTRKRVAEARARGPFVIVVNTQCRGVVLPTTAASPAVLGFYPGDAASLTLQIEEGGLRFESFGGGLRAGCFVPFGSIVTVRPVGTPAPAPLMGWVAPAPVLRTRGHLRLIQGGRS